MTRRVAAAALAVVLAARGAAAQAIATVTVTGPASNPILNGLATFSIQTANFTAADLPLRLELQVSVTPTFDGPLFADTTVNGPNATITVPRLLPGSGLLYWRAIALTARAGSVPSAITGPRTAPTHLRLLSPNNPAGQSLTTRRPTFVWHASAIPAAFGGWEFELRVEETATGRLVFPATTNDTTITLASDLEANTSYRWRVKARLRATGDSVEVLSAGSFVVLSDASPLTTLMLTPFPTPFPSASSARTCVWFDVRDDGNVKLDVSDVRGLPVKVIVPGPGTSGYLQAGRYGRPFPGATSGCDDRFSWDGTDAAGRAVPEGIYVIRLQVGGRVIGRKLVYFRGR